MEESMKDIEREIERQLEREIEKRVAQRVTTGVAILVSVAVIFVVSIVVFKFVWAWVVPDLFPGAVAEGLISADLTWLAAFKLAVLLAALGGFSPALSDALKRR